MLTDRLEIRIINQSAKYYNWLKEHPQQITPYIQGRNYEYAVIRKLRSLGYFCMRSFGSHGASDILAVKNGTALFVQAKHSKVRDTKPEQFNLTELIELAEKHGGFALFAGIQDHHMYFQIWSDNKWLIWKPI